MRGEQQQVHEHPECPCRSCEGTSFRIDKGEYVCTLCLVVNPDLYEEGYNEAEAFGQQRITSFIGGSSQTLKKKKAKLAKIQATASRPWLSIEAAQAIYQGCLVEVAKSRGLGQVETKKILVLGKELWFQYLESLMLVFGKSATIVNRSHRDQEMKNSIKSDGFRGETLRDYNQLLYQKEVFTKDATKSVYSAGETDCATFVLSDVESKEPITVANEKRRKRKKKRPKLAQTARSLGRLDCYGVALMTLWLAKVAITPAQLYQLVFAKLQTFLPRCLAPSSRPTDAWIWRRDRDAFVTSDFFDRLRCALHFAYVNVSPPIANTLSHVVSNMHMLRAMLQSHVRHLVFMLKLNKLRDPICLVADHIFVAQSTQLENCAIVPFIDIYAGAAIYIALVSIEFADASTDGASVDEDAWLDDVFVRLAQRQRRRQERDRLQHGATCGLDTPLPNGRPLSRSSTLRKKHGAEYKASFEKIEEEAVSDGGDENEIPPPWTGHYDPGVVWYDDSQALRKLAAACPKSTASLERTARRAKMLDTRHPLNKGMSYYRLVESKFNGLFYKGRAGTERKSLATAEKRIKLDQRIKLKTQLRKPLVAYVIGAELNIAMEQFGPFIAQLLLGRVI